MVPPSKDINCHLMMGQEYKVIGHPMLVLLRDNFSHAVITAINGRYSPK